MRIFEKGGANFKKNLFLRPKLVVEKLHDFEIICPARWCERTPAPQAIM